MKRYRPPRPIPLRQRSFIGVRDSADPSAADDRYASYLQNVYPQDARFGGGLVGRPGFTITGSSTPAPIQGIFDYQKIDGTRYTVVISNGDVYTLNWSTEAYTVVVGGMSATAPIVYGVVFANYLILSDGVNKPKAFDGTTTATLVNCPVLYGQPVVYYAKLTGIMATDRAAIVWSEEQDPFTGYEVGGYNNAWSLIQTSQSPLTALAATNEALYYFRPYSISTVLGATSPDFRASGVQESVSSSTGTSSPASVVVEDRSIYFLDSDARPQRIVSGLGLQQPPIWENAREAVSKLNLDLLPRFVATRYSQTGLVLFGVASNLATNNLDHVLVFHGDSGNYVGVWNGWIMTAMEQVTNPEGKPQLLHGYTQVVSGITYGRLCLHGDPKGTVWNDYKPFDVPIEHIVEGTPLGYDEYIEKHFDRIDLSLRLTMSFTNAVVKVVTPVSTVQLPAFSRVLPVFDQWKFLREHHVALGLSSYGRWIRPRLTHNALDEKFSFLGWTVQSLPQSVDPLTP